MDRVFGREGREDEELGSAWDCGYCYLFMTSPWGNVMFCELLRSANNILTGANYLGTCQEGGKRGRWPLLPDRHYQVDQPVLIISYQHDSSTSRMI